MAGKYSEGVLPSSPGLHAQRATLGLCSRDCCYPNGVAPDEVEGDKTPLG